MNLSELIEKLMNLEKEGNGLLHVQIEKSDDEYYIPIIEVVNSEIDNKPICILIS